MVKNFSKRTWCAVSSIPPLKAENLLPVVMMLILWVWLRRLGISEEQVFVTVVVLAQVYAIWRNLPMAANSLDAIENGHPSHLRWPIVILLGISGAQILVNEPIFTQRILTGFCVFFLLIMFLGIRREREMLDRVVPLTQNPGQSVQRVSLLRINALAAAMVIAVNEILIANETLVVWITVMPIFAMVMHAFYWFMVLMVLPVDEDADKLPQ